MNRSNLHRCLTAVTVLCLALTQTALLAQTAQEGKNVGALAPENLNKRRAPAPINLTGTYNYQLKGGVTTAALFLPLPKLTAQAQAQLDKHDEYAAKGLEYRDDPAACWPLGLPFMMTRFWPVEVVQLPTEVMIIAMFDNSIRWIYTDGRQHPQEDDLVYSYNGHSIGHWEGKSLVVDTVGLTDDHHWIQYGVPASTKLHVVERLTLSDDGKMLNDEFTMTDPDNWAGEWKNTKHWIRDDHADIEEHTCIYEQMNKLPSFKQNVRE